MGLAPYGQPKYKDIIMKELVDLKDDGSFRLNMKYFKIPSGEITNLPYLIKISKSSVNFSIKFL